MNIEKMTTTLQEAIAEAQQIAVTRKHQDIDIAHVWKIFLQPNHFGRNFYTDAGLDVESFEHEIDRLLDEYPVVSGGNVQYGQNLSQNFFRLWNEADQIRESFGDEFLSTEVVILALMKLKNYPLTAYLNKNGLSEKELRKNIEEMRGGERVTSQNQEEQYKALLDNIIDKMNQYTADEKIKFEADMKAIIAKGQEYINQAQADWQAFLETIQESMDGDVALNLQNKIMNLTADQLVFSKNDLPFEYPEVEVLALTNGLGITALGEENWLGDIPETIPMKIGYPTKNAVTVKVPNNWKMSTPKITEISENIFLLNEGNKSLQITLKEKR